MATSKTFLNVAERILTNEAGSAGQKASYTNRTLRLITSIIFNPNYLFSSVDEVQCNRLIGETTNLYSWTPSLPEMRILIFNCVEIAPYFL